MTGYIFDAPKQFDSNAVSISPPLICVDLDAQRVQYFHNHFVKGVVAYMCHST